MSIIDGALLIAIMLLLFAFIHLFSFYLDDYQLIMMVSLAWIADGRGRKCENWLGSVRAHNSNMGKVETRGEKKLYSLLMLLASAVGFSLPYFFSILFRSYLSQQTMQHENDIEVATTWMFAPMRCIVCDVSKNNFKLFFPPRIQAHMQNANFKEHPARHCMFASSHHDTLSMLTFSLSFHIKNWNWRLESLLA